MCSIFRRLAEAFIKGAAEIGVPRNEAFNGAQQTGAGYHQLTTHQGLRCSSAKAYLRPARRRPNLHIKTGAQVQRLLFEGRRASGVVYRQGSADHSAQCRAELLLAAGALQSPQLLQLSGVGPAPLLQSFNIPVLHALPGVGGNLQDHLQMCLSYECRLPITTNDQLNSLMGKAQLGLQWLLFRSGPLAVGINQGGCFMRALPDETGLEGQRPDIQFHVATLSADMAGGQVHPYSGFTFSVCQLRPQSRGLVRLRSTNPFDAPSMQPNYLSADLERRTAVAPAMRPYVKREVKPGPEAGDDAALLEFCRNQGATIFHPSGTCKMGPDAQAVVDHRLRVHGLQGLRVVDCSVMPTLVSGNTHAAVVMMAEKAVDMIRQDAKAAA